MKRGENRLCGQLFKEEDGPLPAGVNRIVNPLEQALVGITDPENPVEILRLFHSFDPCVACGMHVIDKGRDKTYNVKVL